MFFYSGVVMVLSLLERLRGSSGHVTFDESRSQVCDAACRAAGVIDRARTHTLLYR
jgi:hypothetical protein